MFDGALYESDDVDLSRATEVRRARLAAQGTVSDDWSFKGQFEFTGTGSEMFKDLYIAYEGLGPATTLRIGQFQEFGSLEDSSSSKYITFMERALPVTAFVPAEWRIGVGVDTHGDAWYAGAGLFGESAGETEEERDGMGASVRLTAAPLCDDGRTLHVGLWTAYRTPRGDETLRIRTRPEAHVDDTRLVDTGTITNVNAQVSYGLELAGVSGPFSLQSEYLGAMVERDGLSTESYAGWYATASWILTGESRPYDPQSGTFGRLRPAHDAGEGGSGAWEIVARVSSLDLDDGIRGGTEDNVTLGVNWYVNAYTRFMLNYVNVSVDREANEAEATIVQLRAQIDF